MLRIVVFQGLRPIGIGRTPWKDMLSIPAVSQKLREAQNILDEEKIKIEGQPLNLRNYCEGAIPQFSNHTLTILEHPVIFLTSIALWETEKPPCDAVMGFSKGEWTAIVAAGCVDFREGFLTIVQRGILTSQTGGASLLVRGDRLPIKQLRAFSAATKGVWLANISSWSQGIISGRAEKIQNAQGELQQIFPQLKISPIDIGGAFHTPLMKKARKDLEAYLRKTTFRKPKIPIILNATGEIEEDPETIKQFLLRQMTSRLYFLRTARKLPRDASINEIAVPLGGRATVSQFLKEGREKPGLRSPRRSLADQSA